jgi:hypothetical protein
LPGCGIFGVSAGPQPATANNAAMSTLRANAPIRASFILGWMVKARRVRSKF